MGAIESAKDREGERAREPASEGPARDDVDLLDLVVVIAEQWKLIVLGPLFVGAVALGLSFLITPSFTATTRILPPQQQSSAAAMLAQQLGAISGLAAGAVGLKNPLDQHVALIESRTVADRIVERFGLKAAYGADLQVDARDALASRTRVTAGKDGLIRIEVDDPDPARAAAVANGYVEELMRLTNQLALGEAAQRRVFFERQLQVTKENLIAAEAALKASGVPESILKAEPKAVAESIGRLKAAVTASEVRLSSLRNYLSETNPDYRQAQQELVALRAQVAKAERDDAKVLSVDGTGYIARYRDFKYQETLFEMIAKQYEMARFDEAREGNLVQIVDPAVIPERKSRPKKAMIALAASLVAMVIAVVLAFLRQGLRTASADPVTARKLSRMRAALPLSPRARR